MVESKFINLLIGLFGLGRAKLGEWPHGEAVDAAIASIRELGGQVHHTTGTPGNELEIFHLRVRGRRIRLCVEDYGDVVLWGPKALLEDISTRVVDRLAHTKAG